MWISGWVTIGHIIFSKFGQIASITNVSICVVAISYTSHNLFYSTLPPQTQARSQSQNEAVKSLLPFQ